MVQAVLLRMCSISWILMCFISIKLTLAGNKQKQSNAFFYDDFYNSSVQNDTIQSLVEAFKQNYPIRLWKYYGLFKDDFILKINLHWLRFPPPSAKTHYFLAGLYIIIMTLGMLGNALVIVMIAR